MNDASRPVGGPPSRTPRLPGGVVAAREELALGEVEQAAAILADLETDLAAALAGLDAEAAR